MLLTFIFLILGFVFLIKGAQLLIDGAISLAKKFNVSNLFIGLTIVAFGTSAPELFINIISNLKGSADIAFGNILGANISNVLLVVGLAAMVYPVAVKNKTAKKEIFLALAIIALLSLLANNFFINLDKPSWLSQLDGIILLIFFFTFLYYTLGRSQASQKEHGGYHAPHHLTAIAYIIIGIAGLIIGGQWAVSSASAFARALGLSEVLIGLTVISIGSTLPELITSITAAIRKKADIAIGNMAGSVIFNASFILGLSSLIKPMMFNRNLNADLGIVALTILLLFYFILIGKKRQQIERHEGVFLFCAYLVYLAFLVWRG